MAGISKLTTLARIFGTKDLAKTGKIAKSLFFESTSKKAAQAGWKSLGKSAGNYLGAGSYGGRGWTRSGFSAARIGATGIVAGAAVGGVFGALRGGFRTATSPFRSKISTNQPIIRVN